MSKRFADDGLSGAPENKKATMQLEQIVCSKRVFMKDKARVNNDVIHKLECKGVSSNSQSLIYVESKTIFDKIEENCSYRFTVEKRNLRLYLLDYQLIANVTTECVTNITEEHFLNKQYIKINFKVLGAYKQYDAIKIFGLTKVINFYSQCDLIVPLDRLSCFDYDGSDSKTDRVNVVLTQIYNKLINKWWKFEVICDTTNQDNYVLKLKPRSKYEETDHDETVNNEEENISYRQKKIFSCFKIASSECSKKGDEGKTRLEMKFTTTTGNVVVGSMFTDKEDTFDNAINIGIHIENGSELFCVCSRNSENNNFNVIYYNIHNILVKEADDDVVQILC
ncbi:LEF-3 [Plodia interpunctella granulovirus]|uniref:LEF-3 n=1 Tax=Plodia interpunctella granulovirus TaxID=262175 RepID=A0A1L5JGR5_9BBAC|nr:LEF-3 [Plodia interpunctella granulovirus]APO13982.1 LEF-3 [Plodia interpunctella granulovirus]